MYHYSCILCHFIWQYTPLKSNLNHKINPSISLKILRSGILLKFNRPHFQEFVALTLAYNLWPFVWLRKGALLQLVYICSM
jgi:hypothetical protein